MYPHCESLNCPAGPADAFRVTWSEKVFEACETFCLTWGGAFGIGRAVNNFSALMKDVQQPWRVQRIK